MGLNNAAWRLLVKSGAGNFGEHSEEPQAADSLPNILKTSPKTVAYPAHDQFPRRRWSGEKVAFGSPSCIIEQNPADRDSPAV